MTDFSLQGYRAQPINTIMLTVADALIAKQPIVVILEPGDATRYMFMVTPCTAMFVDDHLRSIGVPWDKAKDYVILTRINSPGASCVVRISTEVFEWDFEGYSNNQHTRQVLAWWFNLLRKELGL